VDLTRSECAAAGKGVLRSVDALWVKGYKLPKALERNSPAWETHKRDLAELLNEAERFRPVPVSSFKSFYPCAARNARYGCKSRCSAEKSSGQRSRPFHLTRSPHSPLRATRAKTFCVGCGAARFWRGVFVWL